MSGGATLHYVSKKSMHRLHMHGADNNRLAITGFMVLLKVGYEKVYGGECDNGKCECVVWWGVVARRLYKIDCRCLSTLRKTH